jgi:hypothetical protein
MSWKQIEREQKKEAKEREMKEHRARTVAIETADALVVAVDKVRRQHILCEPLLPEPVRRGCPTLVDYLNRAVDARAPDPVTGEDSTFQKNLRNAQGYAGALVDDAMLVLFPTTRTVCFAFAIDNTMLRVSSDRMFSILGTLDINVFAAGHRALGAGFVKKGMLASQFRDPYLTFSCDVADHIVEVVGRSAVRWADYHIITTFILMASRAFDSTALMLKMFPSIRGLLDLMQIPYEADCAALKPGAEKQDKSNRLFAAAPSLLTALMMMESRFFRGAASRFAANIVMLRADIKTAADIHACNEFVDLFTNQFDEFTTWDSSNQPRDVRAVAVASDNLNGTAAWSMFGAVPDGYNDLLKQVNDTHQGSNFPVVLRTTPVL